MVEWFILRIYKHIMIEVKTYACQKRVVDKIFRCNHFLSEKRVEVGTIPYLRVRERPWQDLYRFPPADQQSIRLLH